MPKHRIAFLPGAPTPETVGVFAHRPRTRDCNSIEAIAYVLDEDPDFEAQVWVGDTLDETTINHFLACDYVIVNLKHTLWRSATRLANLARVRQSRAWIIGYQEGPADLLATAKPARFERAAYAHVAMDALCCYDRRAMPWFRTFAKGRRVFYLPLPAALDVYDCYRQLEEARHNMIQIAPPFGDGRGGSISANVALAAAGDDWLISFQERTTYDMGLAAEWCAHALTRPRNWLPWQIVPASPSPFDSRPKKARNAINESFLETLAVCRLAVNMDTAQCYGRFVSDCAGLGVPCVGSNRIYLQNILFPALTYDPLDVDGAIVDALRLRNSAEDRTEVCGYALANLRQYFHVNRIREHWHRIVTELRPGEKEVA